MSLYETEEIGIKNTESHRIFFKQSIAGSSDSKYVSPFHDIPLYTKERGVYRMIVEIPRWTNAKMEICKTEPFNPIRQDSKKGKLRFVDNCFPYHGYIWNYGALPQTWEMPEFQHEGIEGCGGDNDPIDVIDIGSKVHASGSVVEVKVLGALAMIDEGELDWKIVAIDVTDPLSSQLNDLSDLKIHTPGLLKATLDWFRIYKIPAGSPPNRFAFDEQYQDREAAIEAINITHALWTKLINGDLEDPKKYENFKLLNTTLDDKASKLTASNAKDIVNQFISNLLKSSTTSPTSGNEKVNFIHKKELLNGSKSSSSASSKKGENQNEDFPTLVRRIFTTSNVIIPIALSAFVGLYIYSCYNR